MKRITVTVYLSPELKEAVRIMAGMARTNESTFLKTLIVKARDEHRDAINRRQMLK
jgi:hypothetical protein